METSNKIFCKNCRYLRFKNYDHGGDCGTAYVCGINPVQKQDWNKSWYELQSPEKKNVNNDCQDFNPGEPQKFWRWNSLHKISD